MQLTVLLGAPGAGKTTLLSHLHGRAGLLVADMDEILENGQLLGLPIASPDGAVHWPAYNRLWVRIIAMVTRAGVPVVLSAPVTPSEWNRSVAEVGLAMPATFVLLDCGKTERSRRLRERGWSAAQISAAITDATELRVLGLPVIDTTERPVAEAAADLSRLVVPDRGRNAV
jgi:broad-specificity NMP kinase